MGIILGCFDENELMGFCAATTLSSGFHANVIKNNLWVFSIQGIKIAFTNSKALIRLFKNISKGSATNEKDKGDYAELLSIATLPDKRGLGIGRDLLLRLEKELIDRQCTRITLTTDFYNNEKTIDFYKRLGYLIWYDFTSYPNRKMYKLIKEFPL
jgi:ribosomal protein S18 acetylase RimI-like enzyme